MSAFLLTAGTCFMTLGGGLLAFRLEAYRGFVLAFAAGALVATALVNLVPDALDLLTRSGSSFHHHHVMIAVCLGFLAFYLLEQSTHDTAHVHDPMAAAGLWGATGIGIHSLVDGVAIGEAFQASSSVGWLVATAVIVHKFADGVSTAGILISSGRTNHGAKAILVLVALAPLAGLLLQYLVPLPPYMLAFVLGWFAGVFLYLGAAALIPAAHELSSSRWLSVATLAGAAMVYFVRQLAG
jgi:ZIP family zinc transporter